MASIDLLLSITRSKVRASIIGLLFGDDPRPRHAREIARESSLTDAAVRRELAHLVKSGLVLRRKAYGSTYRRTRRVESYMRPYSANVECPTYFELRRIAMRTRGAAAAVDAALPKDVRLAWIAGPYATGRSRPRDLLEAVVIGAPKRFIIPALSPLEAKLGRPVKPIVMNADEWNARYDKHETVVRRLRASAKLWLRGDADALRKAEIHKRESQDLLKKVLAGDDYTDEWDEDWDPQAPFGQRWPDSGLAQ